MVAAHVLPRWSVSSPSSMQVEPLSPTRQIRPPKTHAEHSTQLSAANGLDSPSARYSPTPPPGARPPTMIRRASRFDPMEGMPEEESHGELGPRHPLRRIREDPRTAPPPPSDRERGGGDNGPSVSLPGIKALLNSTDQPSLVSPFGGSYFNSSTHASATSPLDSPTSRASRFSSLGSSIGAESQGGGWWAPDERSSSSMSGGLVPGRSSSYSGRGSQFDDGPEYKRRRSDLAPIPADADETARLKWQAQSRNASFPVSSSISSSSASSLRSMLYPPPAPSSSMSRASLSHTPLASSPLSGDSPFDHHISSSRGSPMSGPAARSFADLSTASERSPSQTPSRPRSPTDRRPSMFPRGSISLEPLTLNDRRGSAASLPGRSPDASQRLVVTRPPSPDPAVQPRRSSLAELIKVSSGDDVALANGGRFYSPSTGSKRVHPDDQAHQAWSSRRESVDSVRSIASLPSSSFAAQESNSSGPSRERRNAVPPRIAQRRAVDEDDVPEPKGSDPAMRGMEVLAESATRVADAERIDVEDKKPSQTPPAQNGRGIKNGTSAKAVTNNSTPNESNGGGETSGSGPKYCCDYCGKSFSRPSSLRIHIYSHTGERPFVCSEPQCGRSFSVQSNLKRHAKVHEQAQQAAAHAAQNAAAQQEQAAQHMAAAHQHQQQGPGPLPPPQHVGHAVGHQQVYGYSVRSHPQQHHGHPGPQPHPAHMGHPHHPQHGYGPPPPGFMPSGPAHPYHGQPHPAHPSHHYAPQALYMRPGPPPRGPPGGPPHGDHRVMQHHHEMAQQQQRRRSHDAGPAAARAAYLEGGGRRGSGPVVLASEEEDELDELDEDER